MRSIILDDLQDSPFSLVTFAYQAGLRSQGIPGWRALITAHQHQKINSLDIVQKAVEANLLPTQLLTNQEYINAVETGLYLYYSKQPESKAVSLVDKFWVKLSQLTKLFEPKGENPGNLCAPSISLKQQRSLDKDWQNFDRQLFVLRSQL
ncbi:hypothetical protein H6F95_16290 [Cyanobacteria bacterium FACHB-471]|nr:hypothetical protein [Cyanobacteria bacterium FACHB-471]